MATVKRENPKAFETLLTHLKELEGKVAKVGWFETSKYESGRPVAAVAAGNELGIPSRSIPPRPFMRPTFAKKNKAWGDVMASGAKAVIRGSRSVGDVMETLGLVVQEDIKTSINEVYSPPLSPITIALRARRAAGKVITGKTVGEVAREVAQPGYTPPNVSTKPLEDTRIMITTLQSKVEDETP